MISIVSVVVASLVDVVDVENDKLARNYRCAVRDADSLKHIKLCNKNKHF